VDDDEPLDPFSAQLASADRVVFVRRAVKKKHAKITAESIQDSLLDSLANPTLGQQATGFYKLLVENILSEFYEDFSSRCCPKASAISIPPILYA
jgi:hypothetical protein